MIWPLFLGLLASAATLFGGVLTLRARRHLAIVTGASAGIVLGVALLDLIPEAASLAGNRHPAPVMVAAMLGGAGYLAIGRMLDRVAGRGAWLRRQIGPATLTLHSLMDGAGIGLAFQVSSQMGWVVAAAVIGHDIADGVNIVGLTLDRGGEQAITRRWLAANALAPMIGAAAGGQLHPPPGLFTLLLALLAGIFAAIASAELLPRSVRLGRPAVSAGAAAIGFAVIALVGRLHG